MKKKFVIMPMIVLAVVGFAGCFGCEEGGSGDGGEYFGGDQSQAKYLHLDSESTAALLNMDTDSMQSSRIMAFKALGEEDTEASPIQGMDLEGIIYDALRCFTEEQTDVHFERDGTDGLSVECWSTIPRIVTIAECNGYVYLVFEHPFMVRTETPAGESAADYSDPWSSSSPFTSQLLRSSVAITDYEAGDRLQMSNLEGVIFGYEVNTWDRRRNVQFDGSCNLYLTIHTPGASTDRLVMIAPGAEENVYSEVINANICYERYLVTSGGDVHYTGRTAEGGDCGGGDSFYRMVDAGGTLYEITRDWWDYVFEPRPGEAGKVVFYGPDPREGGVASWDSACIFEFDSSQVEDARYTKLVDCTNDWWRYVAYGPDTTTAANDTEHERCDQQFYTFRGGNSPEEILFFDKDSDGTDDVFVVANTEYKLTGTWKCNICVNNDVACENSDGMLTADVTDEATCEATTGNVWQSAGNHNECYNDVTTTACDVVRNTGNWDKNNEWCENPGTNWSLTYAALSVVKGDGTVELISDPTENVTNAWVVGSRVLYSAVVGGEYKLVSATFDENGTATKTDIIEGVEMYEVSDDPTADTDRILINGLQFSDNSYVFGSYDFTTGDLNVDTGLTGMVDTVLIVGGE